METEYRVPSHLHENEQTFRSKLFRHNKLSLGAVNNLIKKIARSCLIKIEKLNSCTVLYIVTSQGIKENTTITCQFYRHSYHQILNIISAVEKLINGEETGKGKKEIILSGPADGIEVSLKILRFRH